jgi:tetratricopeptide (TPR) repeat protein
MRASAAAGLNGNVSLEVKSALVEACKDEYRLVRIAAANSLALFRNEQFTAEESEVLKKATNEYMTSVVTRKDDWSSHYNLGLFYQNKGETGNALQSYETAANLYPESLMPLINSSVLYSYIGNNAKAEENLRRVIEIDPENEAANLNLGLLLAEQGRINEAEQALRMVLKTNPEQAVAAYNLSVITSQQDIKEAIGFAEVAARSAPGDPKYAYTLAFYQMQDGQKKAAIKTLNEVLKNHPQYLSAVSLLADLYIKDGNTTAAVKLYQDALKSDGLSAEERMAIQQSIASLQRSM